MPPFGNLRVFFIGLLGTFVLISGTWLVFSLREESKSRGPDQQAKGPEKPPGPNGAKEPEKPREDPSIAEERRALSKAKLQATLGRKAEISEMLTTLENEVTAWETRIPGLLKSDDGKKIAVNPARVEQFAAVTEKERVSKARVRQLRDQLDTLMAPIERAILQADTTYTPSETIQNEIEKIGVEVRTKLRDLREIKVVIDTLLADSALTKSGEKALEKAIADLEAERARRRGELVAKAKTDEHDKESKLLADAAAKAEQDLANARRELLKIKTDAEKHGIEIQIEDAKRKVDAALEAEQKRFLKAKREAKFDAEYPKMKSYLLPITSPGFMQFSGGGPRLVMSTTKGPMSLAALTGSLKKGRDDTVEFARAISNTSDRPQGAFPHCSSGGAGQTPQNFDIWYRIQDFIAEFGDIMVERKLLAP